jgi:small GTP-binding protein
LKGHDQRIGRIAWSRDARNIAASSTSRVIVWDATAHSVSCEFSLPGPGAIWDIDWSPDANWLAVAKGSSIAIVRRPSEVMLNLTEHTGRVYSVAWSPDWKFLASASGDHTIRIWNVVTGAVEAVLRAHARPVYALAWSPDGHFVAAASKDRTISLWDSSHWRQMAQLQGHTSWVVSLAWSHNGAMLVSGSTDETIRIWDPHDARPIAMIEGHTDGIYWVAVSGDDEILASKSADHTIRLWDCRDWGQLGVLAQPESDYGYYWPARPAFHPSRAELAAIEGAEGTIGIWAIEVDGLRRSAAAPAIYYAGAKVVLLGDSGVGKSALARSLAGASFEQTESTYGRSVLALKYEEIQLRQDVKEIREVLLWDLGGQAGYRLLHQLRLSQVDVALIVFDSGSADVSSIRFWVTALRQAQPRQSGSAGPQIVLVGARSDRGLGVLAKMDFKTDDHRSYLRRDALASELASELDLIGPIYTSSRTGLGVSELSDAIRRAIRWDAMPKLASTELLQRIKAFLIAEKESGRQLSTTDELYRAFIAQQIAEGDNVRAEFDTAIRLVSSAGLITMLTRSIPWAAGALDSYGLAGRSHASRSAQRWRRTRSAGRGRRAHECEPRRFRPRASYTRSHCAKWQRGGTHRSPPISQRDWHRYTGPNR